MSFSDKIITLEGRRNKNEMWLQVCEERLRTDYFSFIPRGRQDYMQHDVIVSYSKLNALGRYCCFLDIQSQK